MLGPELPAWWTDGIAELARGADSISRYVDARVMFRRGIASARQTERQVVQRTVAMAILMPGIHPMASLCQAGDLISPWFQLHLVNRLLRGEVDVLISHTDGTLSVVEFKVGDYYKVRAGIGQALSYAARIRATGRVVRHTALAWEPLHGRAEQAELEDACRFARVVPVRCVPRGTCAAIELETIRRTRGGRRHPRLRT